MSATIPAAITPPISQTVKLPVIDNSSLNVKPIQSNYSSRSNSEASDSVRNFGMGSIGRFSGMSAVNYEDLSGMDKSSSANESIQAIERRLYAVRPGRVVTSNRSSDKSNAMIISDLGVTITSAGMVNGLSVNDKGVNVQGPIYFTSKGTSIHKGEFTENPNSSNIFTYQETILPESIAKEKFSEIAGKAGINSGAIMDGLMPIITDISPGPLPHVHTISMKHAHRVEPAYLYRMPKSLDVIKGAMGSLGSFYEETGNFGSAAKLVGSLS